MTALISRRTVTHVMAPLVTAGVLLPGSGALAVEGGEKVAERFYPAARAPKKGLVVYGAGKRRGGGAESRLRCTVRALSRVGPVVDG